MIIKSLDLTDFRNYEKMHIDFSRGTNILYGDNAQGKTNILEAIFLSATGKSHKGCKDSEIIGFGKEEAHLRTMTERDGATYQLDMHLRKSKSKVISIDGQRLKKLTQLVGRVNVVFFSPEDLSIIKNGPDQRRRFLNQELCQLDESYLYNLEQYNKVLKERNKTLKDIIQYPDRRVLLDVEDAQLVQFGTKIISVREAFIKDLNEIISPIHQRLTGDRESLQIRYDPNVKADEFEEALKKSREKDIYISQTSIGPQKDDFSFLGKEKNRDEAVDFRKYGSQGQQRTASLSLKLSEIEIVKKAKKENPILLLDDVLSELDSNRQNDLLDTIGGIQTIITCTGLDEFVNHRFTIDKLYSVKNGTVSAENDVEE